jgi:transposase InsO family protein
MCAVLGVSTSGFYDWLKRGVTARELDDQQLLEKIREIFEDSRQTYGYRRVRWQLARNGVSVNDKRVRRLMRQDGLEGRVPRLRRRVHQIAAEGVHAPDLVRRDWNPTEPNRLWVADITYIRTWQGWLYLAAIMDACSRRIVGWSMQPHMRSELVQDALDMAVARRRPAAGLVHHTDHGSQYTALTFGHELRKHGIEPSMGRVRTCYDNAVAESFFATLKKDLVNRYSWPTRHDAQVAIFEYIEVWYNTQRLHSTLGYKTPAEFEEALLTA